MAPILIRGLDETTKQLLVEQARAHGRSMDAEVTDILTKAVHGRQPHIGLALLRAGQESGGVDELPVPDRRDPARSVDFG